MTEIIAWLMIVVAVIAKLIILVKCSKVKYYCDNDECNLKCYCSKYRSELGLFSLMVEELNRLAR